MCNKCLGTIEGKAAAMAREAAKSYVLAAFDTQSESLRKKAKADLVEADRLVADAHELFLLGALTPLPPEEEREEEENDDE